jgi:hypothetical protein
MDVNLNAKDLDAELNKLATLYESGGGYGSPEGELEHQRKFQLLMHRQNLQVKKFASRVTVFNVALTALNIGVLIYQVFFKV